MKIFFSIPENILFIAPLYFCLYHFLFVVAGWFFFYSAVIFSIVLLCGTLKGCCIMCIVVYIRMNVYNLVMLLTNKQFR